MYTKIHMTTYHIVSEFRNIFAAFNKKLGKNKLILANSQEFFNQINLHT